VALRLGLVVLQLGLVALELGLPALEVLALAPAQVVEQQRLHNYHLSIVV